MLLFAEFRLEFGFIALHQQLGLLDPLISFYSSPESAELRIDSLDIGGIPVGNLLESGDAKFGEDRHELGADALDPRQIVGTGTGTGTGTSGTSGTSAGGRGR
jgi:hypothetical protein